MRVALGLCAAAFAAALAAGSSAASAARPTGGVAPPDYITFPARPAAARELPPSRIDTRTLDVTWGAANPRAIEAFRAARLGASLRALASPDSEDHAGQGYYLLGTSSTTFGAYANHSVYPQMRESGNPMGSQLDFLYAPTFFGPGADCIEAVTVVQNAAPQVWAWDWCSANPNPYAVVNVDPKFVKNYIRRMPPDKLRHFTVETILASDNVTWDMALFNYRTKAWDIIYQTSGVRNPSSGLGQQGWNFFETYTNVNNNVSGICSVKFPGPIAADDIALTFDQKTFTPITASDSTPLQFSSFFCPTFRFSTPQADEWEMRNP